MVQSAASKMFLFTSTDSSSAKGQPPKAVKTPNLKWDEEGLLTSFVKIWNIKKILNQKFGSPNQSQYFVLTYL